MFQAGQAADNVVNHPSSVKGRKDSSGQEKIIETSVIKDRLEELEKLYGRTVASREAFNDAVKSAAEDSGLLSAVVRKYIVTRAKDKLPEEQRKAEQLSLLFLDVGDS